MRNVDKERFPLLWRAASGASWTDEFPNGDDWAAESEKWIRVAERHGQGKEYEARLRGRNHQRDAALAELAVAYFLEERGGVSIVEWAPPGAGTTVGEFLVAGSAGSTMFVEVNAPSWEREAKARSDAEGGDEAERKSRWEERRAKGKWVDGEAGWTAPWRSLRDAIEKKTPKFALGRPNLLMLRDDLFVELTNSLLHAEIALYEPANPGHVATAPKDPELWRNNYLNEDGCFVGKRYANLGGVGVLNPRIVLGRPLEYPFELFLNPNCDPSVAIPADAFPGVERRTGNRK